MTLFGAKLQSSWQITPNLRKSYVSLADTMGWFLYQNKTALLAAGWTIKFSCGHNGISLVGPTSAIDTTDRWISSANAQTRGATGVAGQAYAVLQNSDGLQILFAFQGASDDIGRVSYSPGGLFILAGTSTHQPTATDEVIVSALTTLVSTSTVDERLMTIWCSTDTRQWSHIIGRAWIMVHVMGVERVTNYCGTGVFSVPYVGYRHTDFRRSTASGSFPVGGLGPASPPTATAIGAASFTGTIARVFTNSASRLNRLGGGFVTMCGAADTFNRNYNAGSLNTLGSATAMQGRMPLTALYWSGEKSTNLDGVLGCPIDWWLAYGTGAAAATPDPSFQFMPGYDPADTPGVTVERSNWLIALGPSMVRPWRDVAPYLYLG